MLELAGWRWRGRPKGECMDVVRENLKLVIVREENANNRFK